MGTRRISVRVPGQGLHEITREVSAAVQEIAEEIAKETGAASEAAGKASEARDGLCTIFIPHTSASLTIQENADPSAQHDLERWLERLVPEGDPIYTHTAEGPDDMPAHIKAALTATSISIPVLAGRLALGTWQGIFLWEHRHARGQRNVVVHVGG